MKILNFTLFFILCNLFFIGELKAQILLPGFEIEPANTGTPCNNIVPNLVVDHILLEPLEQAVGLHIMFNESDFVDFDHYEMLITDNIKTYTTIGPSVIIIIKVPQTIDPTSYVSCNSLDLSFQIKVVCDGIEYYSNIVPSQNLLCGYKNEFHKASKNQTINVTQPSTSNIVYFRNLQDAQISSVSFYNLEGQELLTKMNSSSSSIFEINLSSLASGMYIAKVNVNEGNFILKKVLVR